MVIDCLAQVVHRVSPPANFHHKYRYEAGHRVVFPHIAYVKIRNVSREKLFVTPKIKGKQHICLLSFLNSNVRAHLRQKFKQPILFFLNFDTTAKGNREINIMYDPIMLGYI